MCQKVKKGAERDKAEGFKAKVEAKAEIKAKAKGLRLKVGGKSQGQSPKSKWEIAISWLYWFD
jgi:hypothetical protein